LHAAANQSGNIHGAAVDVEELAFEAVLAEKPTLDRDPQEGLSRIYRRVGYAQLVGRMHCGHKPQEPQDGHGRYEQEGFGMA